MIRMMAYGLSISSISKSKKKRRQVLALFSDVILTKPFGSNFKPYVFS